jgi:hypothetical protein
MTAALRSLDWTPPRFLLKGMALVSNGGRAFTRDDWLELQRERFTSAGKPAQDGQGPVEGHLPAPEPETAVLEPPAAPPAPFAAGVGMRLSRELDRLLGARGRPLTPPPLPRFPPSDGPMLIRGVASRTEIDSVMTMMVPNALFWDADNLPPLRHKHGEICGQILSLRYVNFGAELMLEARVDDVEAAREGGLSIAFTPSEFEVVDRGGRNWHARVVKARLDECSLTDRPCLASARITARTPAIALEFSDRRYQALADQVSRMKLIFAA